MIQIEQNFKLYFKILPYCVILFWKKFLNIIHIKNLKNTKNFEDWFHSFKEGLAISLKLQINL